MWGICLDYETEAMKEGLCQTVIQYKIDEDGEVVILLPKTNYKPAIEKIRELPVSSPKYNYGELVFPCNHPDITGEICGIGWHFKLNTCIYHIKVDGRVKSKRYFENDLQSVI